MRLLVTRPEEDAAPLAQLLRAGGAEVVIEPLLFVEYQDGPPVDLSGVGGLLVTSANGLRAFARRSVDRGLMVYAVGDASAQAARSAGFTQVESAAGDVEALAELVTERYQAAAGSLLHVAGSRVAGDLKGRLEAAGFGYRRAVLYAVRAAKGLSPETTGLLESGGLDGVLFFSPRTARAFVTLLEERDLDQTAKSMTAYCLSPAVAAAVAALPWDAIETAARPDQASLVAVVEDRARKTRT
jgi:uroporphyrinogen-III synthase